MDTEALVCKTSMGSSSAAEHVYAGGACWDSSQRSVYIRGYSHPHADFEVHDIDFQRVEEVLEPRTRTIDKPTKRSGHASVRQLTFSSMTKLISAKRSMIPMGTFELAMGAPHYNIKM